MFGKTLWIACDFDDCAQLVEWIGPDRSPLVALALDRGWYVTRRVQLCPAHWHKEQQRQTKGSEPGVMCVHCGKPLVWWEEQQVYYGHFAHDGVSPGLRSCDPANSGLPYGYEGHPSDVPCAYPCLGARPPA